ncbi:MAG: hypothetical protein JW856_01780 [Dehalococcoidales bacterium]|nr:hypothetical protein [Dehalococcoidales bacterium]
MRNRKLGFSPEYYERYAAVLNTALSKVAMYRPWKSLDPGPEYPVDVRFAAMPVLIKKDIRDNFPHGVLPSDMDIERGLASGEIQLAETSGTTDDRITNIWDQKWWDASERASWQLNSYMSEIATGDHHEAILVNPRNVGVISDDADLPMEKRRLSRFLYLNEKTDPTRWTSAYMDRMIQDLNIFQPVVLEANPSYLARLCRYIADKNRAVFQPGAIVFTYEYPTIHHYHQIRRIFSKVPLISSYGTTETGYVFMQCEKGKWHQNSEFCRVDFQPFLKEHGGPFLGRILVTILDNPWNYLVRFATGDIVRLEETGKCPCGRSSGLVLSSIEGRKVNLTLTCDGRLVTLFELDSIMGKLKDIDMYKLIQTDKNHYELYLVSRSTMLENMTEAAIMGLKKLYGQEADITVAYQSDIAPENSGKYLVSEALFPIDLDNYLDKQRI